MNFHANSLRDLGLAEQKNIWPGYHSDVLASFGENVTRLRKAAGLKGIELAKRLNVTPPVVSGWEKNRTGLPETPTLLKLAKALRVNIDELLAGVDPDYDLLCHSADQQSNLSGGSRSDVPASLQREVVQLKEKIKRHEALLRDLRDASGEWYERTLRELDQHDEADSVRHGRVARRRGRR